MSLSFNIEFLIEICFIFCNKTFNNFLVFDMPLYALNSVSRFQDKLTCIQNYYLRAKTFKPLFWKDFRGSKKSSCFQDKQDKFSKQVAFKYFSTAFWILFLNPRKSFQNKCLKVFARR